MTLKIGPVNNGSIASVGAFTDMTIQQLGLMIPELQAYTVDGTADALPLHVSGTIIVQSTGVNAMTLGAPTKGNQGTGGDSGRILVIISDSAFAHTITTSALLKTGTANTNVATFAAFAGASLTLRASAGLWYVVSANAVTFTS
jgi:hypothetical protein